MSKDYCRDCEHWAELPLKKKNNMNGMNRRIGDCQYEDNNRMRTDGTDTCNDFRRKE